MAKDMGPLQDSHDSLIDRCIQEGASGHPPKGLVRDLIVHYHFWFILSLREVAAGDAKHVLGKRGGPPAGFTLGILSRNITEGLEMGSRLQIQFAVIKMTLGGNCVDVNTSDLQ